MGNLSSWLANQIASVPVAVIPLFSLALLITAIGFYRRVYFISIGYGFSIAAMALASLVIFRANVQTLTVIQSVLLILYGLRLGSFLLRREMTQAAYRRQLQEAHAGGLSSRGMRDFGIWLGVSLLYVAMITPSVFMLDTPAATYPAWAPIAQGAGVTIMAIGLFIEALADKQKSDFKTKNPGAFCNVGLYRLVRCPNYMGEIMFWSGNWIAGLPAYTTPTRLVISLIGLTCIVLIMMGSTKRLETSQDERYGQQEEYQRYTRSVPVLIPFVPIYSLKNVRVYLE